MNIETFDQWRDHARQMLQDGVSPADLHWHQDRDQPTLFTNQSEPSASPKKNESAQEHSQARSATQNVPKAFLDLAERVACHRSPNRWELLYRTLWRLTHGEPNLLKIATDDDIHKLHRMQQAISRDAHKMKAFVRFRKVVVNGTENYIAWHRPDHRIVRLVAPFFARRFKAMHWTILTRDESVSWDQTSLAYGAGVPVSEAPDADELEDLWKMYYASIFNPARVKVAMMKSEMPVRHWPTLPEAELIPDLLREASGRVEAMIESAEGFAETATHYMPEAITLPTLATAVQNCRACDLCHHATQSVFGEGSKNASIVLVGEQPGDQEDLAGRPFVGPAGKLLNEALADAGLKRDQVYVTNVVKHFKFTEQETPRGKRRLHKKPGSREIYACRPWLEAELALISPRVIVCLGATPAQALLGRDFRITRSRGQKLPTDWCDQTIATWHPAAVLRTPAAAKQQQMRMQLVADLKMAANSS